MPRQERGPTFCRMTLVSELMQAAATAYFMGHNRDYFVKAAGDFYDLTVQEDQNAPQTSEATDPGGNSSNGTEPTDQPSR